MANEEGIVETRTVDIRDAKIHLSKLIKMVRKGSEILLTDRGQPVGRFGHLILEEEIRITTDQALAGGSSLFGNRLYEKHPCGLCGSV